MSRTPTVPRAVNPAVREAVTDVYASLYPGDLWEAQHAGGTGPAFAFSRGRGELPLVNRTLMDLWRSQYASRLLVAYNEFARCAVENRKNYVVGSGFRVRALPADESLDARTTAHAVNKFCELFEEANDLPTRQAETMERLDEDGEAKIRLFESADGIARLRFVQPEHVRPPAGDTSDPRMSFGVETDPNDVEHRVAYWVVETPWDNDTPTRVPEADIYHFRINGKMNAKRGVPTFLPVEPNLRRCEDLLKSMTQIAKTRAKIAMIRKLATAGRDTADAMLDRILAKKETNPVTGQTTNIEEFEAGTILTAGPSQDYVFPEYRFGADDFVSVLQAELRAIASRLVMSEWMFTAVADAKYSNAFITEAPVLKAFTALQTYLHRGWVTGRVGSQRSIYWRAILLAVKAGILPRDTATLVKLTATGPSLEARDRKAEAETFALYQENEWMTRTQIQQKLDVDPDEYRKTKDAEKAADPKPEIGPDGQPIDPNDPAGDGGGKGTGGQPPGKPAGGGADPLPVRETWEEGKHPRADDGKFGHGGSGAGEVIGKGSTGEVVKVGDSVRKNATGKEGKVYAALQGVPGVAAGREEGGHIITPHFPHVISVDAVAPAKRNSMAPIVAKQLPQLVAAVTALGEAGYDYNDPIQVGFDKNRSAHLFDFSAAQNVGRDEATRTNLDHLGSYLKEFGLGRHADALSHVGEVLDHFDPDSRALVADEPEGQEAARVWDQTEGKKPKYAYYSFNAREIPGVVQTEHRRGSKVVFSDEPLDGKFLSQWELLPAIHPPARDTSTAVREAFNSSDHPRDDSGRFVPKAKIDEAKNDPAKAKALLATVTDPTERAKLEKELGDTKPATDPGQKTGQLGAWGRAAGGEPDQPVKPRRSPQPSKDSEGNVWHRAKAGTISVERQAEMAEQAKNPGQMTPEQVQQFAADLKKMTVVEIQKLRTVAESKHGKLKAQLAERLLRKVRDRQALYYDPNDWTGGKDIPDADAPAVAVAAFPSLAAVQRHLNITNLKSPVTRQHIAELAKLPASVHERLAASGAVSGGIYIGDKPMVDLNSNSHLRDVSPRGWAAGKTWGNARIPGAYNQTNRQVTAGDGPHGCASLALHEYGHAIEHSEAFGAPVSSYEMTIHHQRLYDKLDPYQQQGGPAGYAGRSEMFAESISIRYHLGRNEAVRRYDEQYVNWLESVIETPNA